MIDSEMAMMLAMTIEDYMELAPCDCDALCVCDEKSLVAVGDQEKGK
jgi:hypothetical protein